MRYIRNNSRSATALGCLALLFCLALAGCESDALAPQDPPPPLSELDVATQAGLVSFGLAQIGPLAIDYDGSGKNVYTYGFPGHPNIDGQVTLDYRLGGPEGPPATFENGDYVHLATVGAGGIRLLVPDPGNTTVGLTLDIGADIVRGATDSATIRTGSSGTLNAGIFQASFQVNGVGFTEGGSWPTAGAVVFTSGSKTMTVTFNGTALAEISVGGTLKWTVNLDTGEIAAV